MEVPAQRLGAPRPPQDAEGEDGVGGHQDGGGEGNPAGNGGEEHRGPGLDQPHKAQGQQAPQPGEEEAHPAPKLEGQVAVIPEIHPGGVVVDHRHGVLGGGGGQGAAEKQQQGIGQHGGGQQQDEHSPQAVHRAEREKEVALPVPLGIARGPGEKHLQHEPHKAVQHKVPEPFRHARSTSEI